LKEVSLFHLIYEAHQPYYLTLVSFFHLPPSHNYPLTHTVPILQFCLLVLISKSMLKEVSQCIPAESILNFGPFNPFHYSPLCLYLPAPIFQQLSRHVLFLYFHRCYVLWYCWCPRVLFYFPSFTEFHRVVPLLQTCSTYECVYDHVGFSVYFCLLDLPSMYKRNHVASVFLSLTYFTEHDFLQL
jgi:hypothetical protein